MENNKFYSWVPTIPAEKSDRPLLSLALASIDPPDLPPNTELKFWGQSFPATAFGLADAKLKMHIQDGIPPFRCELKVNGNLFRIVEGIPAAQFNYVTLDENGDFADTNCVMENLPVGVYSVFIYDSSEPPQDVRGINSWNTVAPPYATLNGEVNPRGASAVVSFEYATADFYGTGHTYQYVAQYGIVSGVDTALCSLQLSSGGYNSTTNLVPDKLYHYRIKAIINAETLYGEDMTFSTPPAAPIVRTLPATNIHN